MKLLEKWKGVEGNVRKIQVIQFFTTFGLFTPIIVLFFQENGLNMTQVMLLQSFFAAFILLLEVPSGYFADRFGRKNSLMISAVFTTLGFAIYSVSSGFYEFVLGEAVVAIGSALSSGCISALLYDSLIDIDREELYQVYEGKIQSIRLVSAATASIIGGLIAEYSLRAVLYANVPFFFLMLPLAYTLTRPDVHEKEVAPSYGKDILQIVKDTLIDNKEVRNLILYSGVIAASTHAGYFLYQPYFKLAEIDVAYFGLIFAGYNIFAAAISYKASWIEDTVGKKNLLISLPIIGALGFLLMGQFVFYFSFLIAALHQFVRAVQSIVISDYVNKLVGSERRSTVLSIKNMASRVIYASLIPFIGAASDLYSIPQAMIIVAVFLSVFGAFMVLMLHFEDVIS